MPSSPRSDTGLSSARAERTAQDLEWLFKRSPGAREAIQARLREYPDYQSWLQQFGTGLLRAVQYPDGIMSGRSSG